MALDLTWDLRLLNNFGFNQNAKILLALIQFLINKFLQVHFQSLYCLILNSFAHEIMIFMI
ncbi:hypothetical protein BpHYR1_018724 [Brachionus plicatilis]|uniref:Uncharacterized protein n=1 Tax=Brachionus plicatilis TaxID=10195 RepID=A0A3M7S4S2_BRAPC|nr:hypothetical protein BpHYR1_018724 [Brachionus plicatilis]